MYKNNFLIIQNDSGHYRHRHVVKKILNIQNGTVHRVPVQDCCPIFHTAPAPLLQSLSHPIFCLCRLEINKLVGKLAAETLVNQSLYTGMNDLIPFP